MYSRFVAYHNIWDLDGLITNDKFSWTRHYRLKLSWSEVKLRQAAEIFWCSQPPQTLEGTVPLEMVNESPHSYSGSSFPNTS